MILKLKPISIDYTRRNRFYTSINNTILVITFANIGVLLACYVI